MPRIFVSHSSKDNFSAVALADWLRREGWDDVFLDLDSSRGIAAGQRWEQALYQNASDCEAVLFLVSGNWLASDWCRREYELARKLNKCPFVVLIEDIAVDALPHFLNETHQSVRLGAGTDHVVFRLIMPVTHEEGHVTFSVEGLARLKAGLSSAGLDPRFFPWPPENEPGRSPYRGLEALDAKDAGVFFGRDAPVIEALDTLRGVREAAPPRLFVILGASGAGKSSFLRAGLLPRLARDEVHFLCAPPIRPERAAVTGANGLVSALSAAAEKANLPISRAQIREAADAGCLRALLKRLAQGAPGRTIVFAIDQAEELFRAEGAVEGEQLLTLLAELAKNDNPPILILFAIRSDSFDALQHAAPLAGLNQKTFSLPPMPRGAYQTVIEQPAQRLEQAGRKFVIDPALTQTLLEAVEKGGGDALPLLAFTLEQLYREHGGGGRIALADFEKLGRLGGVIDAALVRVFHEADKDARIPKDGSARIELLRRGLIPWLAGIDPESKTPRRRVARMNQIPNEARPLIDLLVEQRLLTRDVDRVSSETTIEPAHEALLRQWGGLKGWLDEDFGLLATLEGVQRAARDWDRNERAEAWAAHGGARLEEADGLDARPDLAAKFDSVDREYLSACRKKELAAKSAEAARLRAETMSARNAKRVAVVSSAGLAAALVLAGLAGWQWRAAQGAKTEALKQSENASRERDEAQKQARRAEMALQDVSVNDSLFRATSARVQLRAGKPVVAVQLALHGLPMNGERPFMSETFGALLESVNEQRARKILPGYSARFIANDMSVLFVTQEGRVKSVDIATGKTRFELDVKRNGFDGLGLEVSPSGTRALISGSNGAEIWDLSTQRMIQDLTPVTGGISHLEFSSDGSRLLTVSNTGKKVFVWQIATNARQIKLQYPNVSESAQLSATLSSSGQYVATYDDVHVGLWDAATGRAISEPRIGPEAIKNLVFSPSGARLLTITKGGAIRVWDTTKGQHILDFDAKGRAKLKANQAAFSPDGSRVVTFCDSSESCGHTSAQIWDAATGRLIATLQGHKSRIGLVVFSRDGKRVLTAPNSWDRGDYSARLWNAVDGELIGVLESHSNTISAAAFSPDGKKVVTWAGGDRENVSLVNDPTLRLWDAGSGNALTSLKLTGVGSGSIRFSADGARILVTCDGRYDDVAPGEQHSTWILDAGSNGRFGFPLEKKGAQQGERINPTFSPKGSYVFTGSYPARVMSVTYGAQTREFPGIENTADDPEGSDITSTSAVFSPDGLKILAASADSGGKIWNVLTGRQIAALEGLKRQPEGDFQAGFSTDGSYIFATDLDASNPAGAWDTATGRKKTPIQGAKPQFDFDGATYASLVDGKIKVWSIGGKQLAVLDGVSGADDFDLSLDGARVLTQPSDNIAAARLWDAATGKEIAKLERLTKEYENFAFRAEGALVAARESSSQEAAASGGGNTIKIWDAETGRLMLTRTNTRLGQNGDIVWTPNVEGDQALIALESGEIELWDLKSGRLLRNMESRKSGAVKRELEALEFSDDGTRIVGVFRAGEASIWTVADGREIAVIRDSLGKITQAEFSPDNSHLLYVTGQQEAGRVLWIGKTLDEVIGHAKQTLPYEMSPQEERMALVTIDAAPLNAAKSAYQESQE